MFQNLQKCLLASALILTPFSAFAQNVNEQNLENAATLLAQELQPFVVTLTHDVQLYHYYKSDLDRADFSPDDPRIQDKFNRTINGQWRQSGGSNDTVYFNPHIYAAIDPAQTRGYGDTAWEIKLSAGLKILAGHLWTSKTLAPATVEALSSLGYASSFGSRFDTFFLSWPKSLTLRVLQKLDVVAGSYNFIESNRLCQMSAGVAFTIYGEVKDPSLALSGQGWGISTSGITVKGFSAGANDFSDPKKLADYSRIEKYLEKVNSLTLVSMTGLQPMSEGETSEWKKNIYSCDNLYPGDIPPAH
jgi:hypothetical protein